MQATRETTETTSKNPRGNTAKAENVPHTPKRDGATSAHGSVRLSTAANGSVYTPQSNGRGMSGTPLTMSRHADLAGRRRGGTLLQELRPGCTYQLKVPCVRNEKSKCVCVCVCVCLCVCVLVRRGHVCMAYQLKVPCVRNEKSKFVCVCVCVLVKRGHVPTAIYTYIHTTQTVPN